MVMKRKECLVVFASIFAIGLWAIGPAFAEMSDHEPEQRIRVLEEKPLLLAAAGEKKLHEGAGDVESLSDRVSRIEEKLEGGLLGKWSDRVTLSGAIEVEAGYEDLDFKDPEEQDTDSSDISLATVELGVDVDIAKHVKGHVLFLYEDGEDIVVDEGIIIIDGEDVVPLYLNAGKMYVPFGNFESHFISNPFTVELGETRESAVKVGFANDMLDICVAAFNGDINEIGESDDHIDNFVASAVLTLPEDVLPNIGLTMGVSWISNIADTNGLQDAIEEFEEPEEGETAEIKDYISGFSAFLSVSFMDKLFFEGEYVGATDNFEADDLDLEPGQKFEPAAWNFELAYMVIDDLEVAVRYEGTDDTLNLLPEKQYGVAATYSLFENTSLSLEYLYGEFENDDERTLLTAQLAIEF